MMSHSWRVAAAVICLCAVSPVLTAATFDLRSDWSLAINPNGVWSYNQGLTPLPYTQFQWGGVAGETFWATTASGTTPPAWARIETATPFYSRADHWEIGDIVGHSTTPTSPPGGSETFGNVRWTSPTAGFITISGRAWDAYHYADRNDQWRLYVDGTLVASRASVYGIAKSDGAALFINNLLPSQSLNGWAVAAGDTVVFEIESVTRIGHFVGVDLTIELREAAPGGTEIPEPSTAIPVLAAIASFGGLRGRPGARK